jgi:hypothetical protein
MKTTGSLLSRDGLGEVVFIVEGSRDADTENADDLVNGARAARSGEDHHRVGVATDGVEDDRAGVLTQSGGLSTGPAGFGVGVGMAGEHLVPQEVLQEAQGPIRCGVVGVGDPAGPYGPGITWSSPITDSRIRRSSGVSTAACRDGVVTFREWIRAGRNR